MAKSKQGAAKSGYSQFKADLKTDHFHSMYIFFGEESYLLENYRLQLRKKLVSGWAEDFNYHRITSENWDIQLLSEIVESFPMMSDRSLIEIIDIDPFSRPESERQAIIELLSQFPDYCTLVWIFDTVQWKPDKRMKKLWSAIDTIAMQVEFPKQSESELIPWIRRHMRAENKNISDELCRHLILQTGGSMTVLAAEIDKIVSYTDQSEITRHDIDAVVIPVMEAAIFDITKDIGNQNFDSALTRLRNLLRQDIEPIAINAIIGRQLRQLYGARIFAEHGRSSYDFAKLYGLWDSAAREVYHQASGFRKQTLKNGILLSASADYAMKTSSGQEDQLLELLILRLAEQSRGT